MQQDTAFKRARRETRSEVGFALSGGTSSQQPPQQCVPKPSRTASPSGRAHLSAVKGSM